MASWDVTIFRYINGLAGKGGWRDAFGVFSATYMIWLMVAVILVYAAVVWWQARGLERRFDGPVLVFRAFTAAVLGNAANVVIGRIWLRPRPFVALSNVVQLIHPLSHKSFPSDHATTAFALAFSVALMRPEFGLVMLVLAAHVALGRVFVGVHYPSDVVAGCLMGLFWALIVRWAGRKWGDRRLLERLLGGRKNSSASSASSVRQ